MSHISCYINCFKKVVASPLWQTVHVNPNPNPFVVMSAW
jgi:hypothetical protein